MARKPNPRRVEVLNEKDELEKLINSDENLASSLKLAESILPERPTVGFLNYMESKKSQMMKREKLLRQLLNSIWTETSYLKLHTSERKIQLIN